MTETTDIVTKELQAIEHAQLPFSYTLSFDNGEEITTTYQGGAVMFVDIVVSKETCLALRYDYKERITIVFRDDCSIIQVTIDRLLCHPEIDQDGGEIESSQTRFVDIIMHTYDIVLEALNDDENKFTVEAWNKRGDREKKAAAASASLVK
jgi:hypothetical protein